MGGCALVLGCWTSPESSRCGRCTCSACAGLFHGDGRADPAVVRQRDGGSENVTNAVALNAMTFNLARVVGPAGPRDDHVGGDRLGVPEQRGQLRRRDRRAVPAMDPTKRHRWPTARQRGQLVEGLRYVRGRTDLVVLLVLVFCVSTFA